MYLITSLVIIISLEVLTIIHHGLATKTAQEECEDMLEEFWYSDKSISGKINFVTAFNTLTKQYINYHFYYLIATADEDDEERIVLQKQIHEQYFYDLFYHHGVELANMMPLNYWCESKVKEEMTVERRYNTELYNFRLEKCIQLIKEKFEIDELSRPYDIFNEFYEKWTTSYILWVADDGASTSQTRLDKNLNNTAISNYPLLFFEYYNKTINDGKFKTIEEFCSGEGSTLVENNIYFH